MGFFSSLFGKYSEDAYSTTARNAIVSAPELTEGRTGVSRYLDNQPSTALSGVEKYLKAQEQNRPSSVAKYLARQTIAEKNKPVVTLTCVAKYLNNNKYSAPVVRTGLARYLDTQDKTPVSGVAKYMLKKAVADRYAPSTTKAKITRVESYLQSLPETTTSGVSKYLAKQAIAVAAQKKAEVVAVVETIVDEVALTGVEKYLKAQH